MDSIRQEKIGRFIQKEISDLLQKDFKHLCDRSLITVTAVNVTADLSIAKIHLSIFGSQNKESVLENMKTNSSEIRFLLGKRIKNNIRHIPELIFFIDDSLDKIERIEKALKNK